MLQSSSAIESNRSYRCYSESVENELTQNSSPESFQMSRLITGMTTNAENSWDPVVSFTETETKTAGSSRPSLLKRLLIGCSILAGTGAFTLGGYYFYVAGRQNTDGHPENTCLSVSSEPPALMDRFLRKVDEDSLITPADDLRSVVNSMLTSEISRSPYSYYERIYGNTRGRNKIQQLTSPPGISGEEIKLYNHDRIRDILYRELAGNYEYSQPLGPVFHKKLSSFCHSKLIKNVIEQAYTSNADQRCILLSRIVDTVNKFKYKESTLLGKHERQEVLLRRDYIQEVMMRRKLTTLLMAAEFIMEEKNFTEFDVAAMEDYKQYSISEMTAREKKIRDYFPLRRDYFPQYKCVGEH